MRKQYYWVPDIVHWQSIYNSTKQATVKGTTASRDAMNESGQKQSAGQHLRHGTGMFVSCGICFLGFRSLFAGGFLATSSKRSYQYALIVY